MKAAAGDPVHQRPAERGSFLSQRRDRLRDPCRGGQVVLDQGGEPGGVLLGDLDARSRSRVRVAVGAQVSGLGPDRTAWLGAKLGSGR